MDLNEAIQWLEGKRSMVNSIPGPDLNTWAVRIAQADAAMTQQAYFVWRYNQDQTLKEKE